MWRALTEEGTLSAWFSDGAILEARDGASGWITFDAVGRYSIRITTIDAPRSMTWEFGYKERPAGGASPQTIEWRLDPRPAGGTLLHLRVSFEREADRAENEEGWAALLDALDAFLEDRR